MEDNGKRAEAERCLGTANKLLMARDLIGSKRFASRAQESDPLLDGVDKILAVANVLLAAEKRINNHFDWYAILQVDRQSNDLELIKRQYQRLGFLLHPGNNQSFFADNAFKLVSDAWAVLSDPSKKSLYDNELNLFSKIDSMASNDEQEQFHQHHEQILQQNPQQRQKQTAKRSPREKRKKRQVSSNSSHEIPSLLSTFWTACPYCYNLYEYPRVYEECSLRCQKCQRAFHAAVIPSPPPLIPGKDAYFCCWGFFPLGFSFSDSGPGGKNSGFPNWMPFSPLFSFPSQSKENRNEENKHVDISDDSDFSAQKSSRKKEKTENGKERASSNRNPKRSPAKKVIYRLNKDGEALHDGHETLGQQWAETTNVAKPHSRKKKMAARKTKMQKSKGAQEEVPERKSGQNSELQDLNLEVDDNVEEPLPVTGEGIETESKEEEPLEDPLEDPLEEPLEEPIPVTGEGIETESREEDPAEGIAFFEGLDDFLGSLPIFSIAGDGKVKDE